MRKELLVFIFTLCSVLVSAQQKVPNRFRTNIPLDSIHLSDPCILTDKKTSIYYMTGTGGLLWKSKDLARWEGPYRVAETDSDSWMGPKPEIWAAELHEYNGKYYPNISGVAQSYNFYPLSYIIPEDGLADIALGLGAYVVGGEKTYRFCPRYPKLQLASIQDMARDSQKYFYAIDMIHPDYNLVKDGEDAAIRSND